ncbi:MAG: alpha/beta hydrolase [Spirochaetaceae bacterium]|nr:alpha/beta hydrolase [Spirochaetaceae bacterium]
MFINLEHADIYTEVTGSDRPMLMLHGNWCDHNLMKGCMENIFTTETGSNINKNWKRIYFDLPGMGNTVLKKEISTTDDIFNIVEEFIHKTIPEEVFYIASESYGSYLARMFIKKYPQRVGGIMMICPVVFPLLEDRNLPEMKITNRDNEFYKTLSVKEQETFDSMFTIQNSSNWERYIKEVRSGVKKSDIALLKKIKKYGYGFKENPDILDAPFKNPSLIITGRQDLSVGYKDAFALIDKYPNSDHVILDEAGHMLQIEQKEIFNKLVLKWISRLE